MTAPSSQEVIHAEPGGSLMPVWVLLGATAALTLVTAVLRGPGDSLGAVVAGAVLGLAGIGPYVVSKRRYGRLEVSASTLRIGRERFSLADVNVALLEEQAGGRRYTGTPAGWFGDRTSEVRVAGGQWGPAVGDRFLVLEVRGRDGYQAVATKDPTRLARILVDAVDEARHRGVTGDGPG